jgi:hypothetical protein
VPMTSPTPTMSRTRKPTTTVTATERTAFATLTPSVLKLERGTLPRRSRKREAPVIAGVGRRGGLLLAKWRSARSQTPFSTDCSQPSFDGCSLNAQLKRYRDRAGSTAAP